MATVRRRTRNILWNRRKSLGANLFNVAVIVPIISIAILPVASFEYLRSVIRRFRYVEIDGTDEQIQREAMRHAPFQFRWLGATLDSDQVAVTLRGRPDWDSMQDQIRPSDRIWPFLINPDTSAMRSGFVVVRSGRPLGVIVTEIS